MTFLKNSLMDGEGPAAPGQGTCFIFFQSIHSGFDDFGCSLLYDGRFACCPNVFLLDTHTCGRNEVATGESIVK